MKILIIDDEVSILETLEMFFVEKGYKTITAIDASNGLRIFRKKKPEIVILDIRLPDKSGFDVLMEIQKLDKRSRVIMITAYHDMEATIQAMKLGACEYVKKPIDIEELENAVKKAARNYKLSGTLEDLSTEMSSNFKPDRIIGNTKNMQEVFKTIGLVSRNRATVLIKGETGTGKELVAKAIHYNSVPNNEPFIPIDCSTLVETLAESELFGHEKGAFTGASERKRGRIELAGNGTVFFDEIGELPLNLQGKFLRFLQEKEFMPVGGEKRLKSFARIIAATNKDLPELVKSGKFRKDLYYRLKVVEINLPPLRERKPDIPLLIDYLLKKANAIFQKNVTKVPKEVIETLTEYHWPGNVRELENLIMKAVALSRGSVLLPEYLHDLFQIEEAEKETTTTDKSLAEIETEYLFKVLEFTNWNQGKACEILGISRPTLRKKIKKYGLRII